MMQRTLIKGLATRYALKFDYCK